MREGPHDARRGAPPESARGGRSGPAPPPPALAPSAACWGVVGALSALVAVLAGAFGAHALRSRLAPELLAAFESGARYQMLHALALLAMAWALDRTAASTGPHAPGARAALGRAAWLFLAGTGLFSGSLYALALSGARGFGTVTPLGGLCFMAGWLQLALGLRRGRER